MIVLSSPSASIVLDSMVLIESALSDFNGPLFEAERALLTPRAAPARIAQFSATRLAAHRALAQLGVPVPPEGIGRDAHGAPIWPSGIVGSLTHTAQRCAAAVTRARSWRGIGIDLELCEPLPEDVSPLVLSPDEIADLETMPGGAARWGRAAFGAKECVHKAIQPLRGVWLDFGEVRIVFDDQTRWRPLPLSSKAKIAFDGLCAVGHVANANGHWLGLLGLR